MTKLSTKIMPLIATIVNGIGVNATRSGIESQNEVFNQSKSKIMAYVRKNVTELES